MTIISHDTLMYQANETLIDGQTLYIRSVRSSDKRSLEAGLEQLSAQSRYFRFFQHKKHFTEKELKYFTEIDFINHVALIASVLENTTEKPVGIGRYIVVDDEDSTQLTAEIAFAVEDHYHGQGIATLLLNHLSAIAKNNNIRYFQADVLANNYKMLEVFGNCGLAMEKLHQGTIVEIRLRLW